MQHAFCSGEVIFADLLSIEEDLVGFFLLFILKGRFKITLSAMAGIFFKMVDKLLCWMCTKFHSSWQIHRHMNTQALVPSLAGILLEIPLLFSNLVAIYWSSISKADAWLTFRGTLSEMKLSSPHNETTSVALGCRAGLASVQRRNTVSTQSQSVAWNSSYLIDLLSHLFNANDSGWCWNGMATSAKSFWKGYRWSGFKMLNSTILKADMSIFFKSLKEAEFSLGDPSRIISGAMYTSVPLSPKKIRPLAITI